MKKIIIILFLIFFFKLIPNQLYVISCVNTSILPLKTFLGFSTNSSNIIISITTNKNTYFELEPVWLSINIRNESERIDSVDIADDVDLLSNLLVTYNKNFQINYHYLSIEHLPSYIKIIPGQEKQYNIEILNGYGNREIENQVNYAPISYFIEGNYNIQSHLNFSNGIIYSNITSFKVIKPDSSELHTFKNILNIYETDTNNQNNHKNEAVELKKIINDHSQSVYVEQAFYYYVVTIVQNKQLLEKGFIDDCLSFFDIHPNSYYNYDILRLSLRPFVKINGKSKTLVKEYLVNLKEKYPNTEISKAADIFLNKKSYLEKITN